MSSRQNWGLRARNKVYKDLASFPTSDQNKIMLILELLPLDPYTGDIQKMKGEENSWRRRAGNYRIFYEIIPADRIVYVFHIERRSSNTY